MRRLKSLAESALARSGAVRAGLRLSAGKATVLAYHNVVPRGSEPEGDTSLHVSLDCFVEQLDALTATHDVVPLAELPERLARSEGRPLAAITFDDGYRGALRWGVEELVERSLPVTIFVSPGLLDGETFWWDALARPGEEGLPAGFRDEALWTWAGEQERIRAAAREAGMEWRELPAWARAATRTELREAASRSGVEIGSHSWSHPNLAEVSESRRREELDRSLTWLSEAIPSSVPWLAYPYGISSPAVVRSCRAAGHLGAVVIGGDLPATSDAPLHAFPRLNIPAQLTLDGFRLRTAGLL